MGCDIIWKGSQPDQNKQKQSVIFLHALFYKFRWNYQLYDECREGNIFEPKEGEKEEYILRNKVNIFGISTILSWGGDLSFFFNNADYLKDQSGKLININELSPDFLNKILKSKSESDCGYFLNEIRYKRYKKMASQVVNSSSSKTYELCNYGTIRTMPEDSAIYEDSDILDPSDNPMYYRNNELAACSTENMCVILYLIKKLFVPNLQVSDDYQIWELVCDRLQKNDVDKMLETESNKWESISFLAKEIFGIDFYKSDLDEQLMDIWMVDI